MFVMCGLYTLLTIFATTNLWIKLTLFLMNICLKPTDKSRYKKWQNNLAF